jgi:hypothetical protein
MSFLYLTESIRYSMYAQINSSENLNIILSNYEHSQDMIFVHNYH